MAATATSSSGGATMEVLHTFFSATPYKPGQGSLVRNGTLVALLVLIVAGLYSWSEAFSGTQNYVLRWWGPVAVSLVLAWISVRVVNLPRFAEFLIATEAEMAKVNWPTQAEVKASTIVVLVNVVILAIFLFGADLVWRFVLSGLGILRIGALLTGSVQG